MTALVVLLALLLLTMWLGRLIQRVTAATYALVALLALLQVSAVLFAMYTMERPVVEFYHSRSKDSESDIYILYDFDPLKYPEPVEDFDFQEEP